MRDSLVVLACKHCRRVHGSFHRAVWRSEWCRRCSGRSLCSETGASHETLAKFIDRDPAVRVDLEDSLEDTVELVRDGQDGLEEVTILHVSPEGGIIYRCSLPWVAATSQVDKNDTQCPHIVGT